MENGAGGARDEFWITDGSVGIAHHRKGLTQSVLVESSRTLAGPGGFRGCPIPRKCWEAPRAVPSQPTGCWDCFIGEVSAILAGCHCMTPIKDSSGRGRTIGGSTRGTTGKPFTT
jgi:hypothetical protein